MKNWRQTEDIWEEFCHANGLTLVKKERHYINGKTQYYSTTELNQDLNLNYIHRYEKPDSGVRPEELTLTFKLEENRFGKIEIRKSGFLRRLFNTSLIKVKSDLILTGELMNLLVTLIDKYPTAKFKVDNNQASLTLNEFPKSSGGLEILRDALKRILIVIGN